MLIPMDLQSCLLESQALFHITQFGTMMHWGLWRGKSLLMLDCPNMWNSRSKTLNKVQLMGWKWFHMWNIGRIFYCICQSRCLSKVPLFWKAFGLQAIGSINMSRLHCHQQWRFCSHEAAWFLFVLVCMGRTQSDVVKDDQNENFKIVRVSWWAPMKKGSKSNEWCLYEDCWNGKWKCNLVDLKKWFNISVIHFYFPTWKNTTNKSQITILDSVLLEQKWILKLLIHWIICEVCWWHW